MAIRSKLTAREENEPHRSASASTRREPTDEEKTLRKERVAAAKDALKRSAGLRGDHVPPARAALKQFLQRLNEPRQPDDATFAAMVEAPFKAPPKKRERR